MRKAAAGGVVFRTGGILVGALALFTLINQQELGASNGSAGTLRGVTPMSDTILALGRTVYEEQRCSLCHSIAGRGSPASSLDGIASRLTAEEIRLRIVDPQAWRPGIRKPAFDLPPEQLAALVAYLGSLKALE